MSANKYSDIPKFGVVMNDELPTDLFDLLSAIRVINREIQKIETTPLQRLSVRFIVGQLVDLALEHVADEANDAPLFVTEKLFDN